MTRQRAFFFSKHGTPKTSAKYQTIIIANSDRLTYYIVVINCGTAHVIQRLFDYKYDFFHGAERNLLQAWTHFYEAWSKQLLDSQKKNRDHFHKCKIWRSSVQSSAVAGRGRRQAGSSTACLHADRILVGVRGPAICCPHGAHARMHRPPNNCDASTYVDPDVVRGRRLSKITPISSRKPHSVSSFNFRRFPPIKSSKS